MIEQPQSILDLIQQLPPECRQQALWVCHWITAWEWCDRHGHCDGIGSHEYWRLTHQALFEKVAPSQAAMRLWIRHQANLPPNPNPNPKEKTSEDPPSTH